MKKIWIILSASLSLAAWVVLAARGQALDHPPSFFQWTRECVTCNHPTYFGYSVAVAVDPSGVTHLAYDDHPGLVYALETSAGWQFETVDTCTPLEYIFLQLSPTDSRPQILYQCDSTRINYGFRDEMGWHVQQILTTADFIGEYLEPLDLKLNGLALDPSGVPHAAVTGNMHRELRVVFHIYQSETGWQVEDVGQGDDGAIALDAAGRPHFARAYLTWRDFRPDDSFLFYSYQDAAGWHSEEVAHPTIGRDVSIAIDRLGWPHIATDGAAPPGNYHVKSTAGWSHSVANIAEKSIFLFDPNDRPFISSNGYSRLIYTIGMPGVGWLNGRFGEDDKEPWTNHGMALDNDGYVYFAYREITTANVIFLRPYKGPVHSVYLPIINSASSHP